MDNFIKTLPIYYLALWTGLIIIDTAGQICMKLGAQTLKQTSFGVAWFYEALASLYIWGAIGCYAASFVIWLHILKQTDLSTAFPISSLNYVTVILASWLIFQEPISIFHLLGVTLIIMGVVVLSWGNEP